MKKITIIITSIFILTGIIFYSCTKDGSNLNNVSNHNTPGRINKSLDLANYDSIGIIHNLLVESVYNSSILPDTSKFIDRLKAYFGYDTVSTNSFYDDYISNLANNFYDEFNNQYSNGIITKSTIRDYFKIMFNLFSNQNIFTEEGKNAAFDSIHTIEICIYYSDVFSNHEKLWLLGTASILRNSFIYWNNQDNIDKWESYRTLKKMPFSMATSHLADAYVYESYYHLYYIKFNDADPQEDDKAVKWALIKSAYYSIKVFLGVVNF